MWGGRNLHCRVLKNSHSSFQNHELWPLDDFQFPTPIDKKKINI